MKLLVTGGSGYLGAAILRRSPSDWEVCATRWSQPTASDRAVSFRLDVRDAAQVDRLIDYLKPDIVIHTAAQMTGNDMLATNLNGSRNIARAAARHRARLIHMSSDVIFDGEHAPYSEQDPPCPIHPYAVSKAHAEQAVVTEYPPAVLVRTSLIYGFNPMDPRTQQTLTGNMPLLFSDEYRCPVFVDDLADALTELALSPFHGVMNAAGTQRVSRYEFGLKLASTFHVPPRFSAAVSASSPVPRPRDCALDVSLATTLLKTRLRGVDEVLSSVDLPGLPQPQ